MPGSQSAWNRRAAARVPADLRAGGPGHHRRRLRGRRFDGVHRPVRLDPQHQRRRRRRASPCTPGSRTHGDISAGLVGQDQSHGSGVGQPRGQLRGRDRQAAPADGCGELPGTQLGVVAWPAARKQTCSAPGTTGGRRTCWTAWSMPSCATRSRAAHHASTARSAGTTSRNNLRWTNDYYDDMALAGARAGALRSALRASSGRRRWTSWPTSSSTPGCPRTAAASRGANRTSSSTPPRTGRPPSSWPATTGCAAPSRWPTGSTKR